MVTFLVIYDRFPYQCLREGGVILTRAIFIFTVVDCDLSAVPVVKHANFTILPAHDGSKLPVNTTATYTCVSGYELENPDNNIAKCEYAFKNLQNHQSRTAVWTGQEKIRCIEGKF